MPTVNVAIDDTFVLRDDTSPTPVAITGKVAADFTPLPAVIEAYLLPSAAATVPVTLTEVGNGEYSITFSPTVVGTWTSHVVYNSGGVFEEFSQNYVVEAAPVDPIPPDPTYGTGGVVLRDVRRSVQERLNDLIVLTCTGSGSQGTLTDAVNLFDSNDAYVGSHLYFVSGTNLGQLAKCDGSEQTLGTISFAPQVPLTTQADDVVDLHNLHGDGWPRMDVVRRIQAVVRERGSRVLLRREDVLAGTFDEGTPIVTCPAGVSHNSSVWWADTDGIYHEVPPHHRDVKGLSGEIEILGSSRWDAHGATIRLQGYGNHPTVTLETDPIYVDPEWLTLTVAAQLAAFSGNKTMMNWAVDWSRNALARDGNAMTERMPNSEKVR